MLHALAPWLTSLFGLLSLCGLGYYLLCLWSAHTFLRDSQASSQRNISATSDSEALPPVSILKPVRGADREMYESFRSHCLQDYPADYELIFGVNEADDPAIALVERLRREFPERRIALLMCTRKLGTNLKVSNLVQMLPSARHDHLLVNDSDIRVERDYLRRVIGEFADPQVGMVTTLYRGASGETLGSKLESVGISTDFAAGVLAARQLEGVNFALGSTLAFTRPSLYAINGFEPLLDYLADDFELGYRIAEKGYKVVLSPVVVDTFLPHYDLAAFWAHQLRWARSTRDSRRLGYMGVGLTFGLPWALLAVVFSHGANWSWALFALVAAARFAMAGVIGGRILRDRQLVEHFWLIPLRDLVALAVWIGAYAGTTIHWRGNDFYLKDGKLTRVTGN
jgi:ceramide glucosyltransferase